MNCSSTRARIAKGTPTKKLERQPQTSVRSPPSSGPPIVPRAMMPPTTPMYLPRSRGEMMRATAIMTSDMSPPTPMPWITRTAISMLVSVEKPAITVPTVKMTSESCTRILRSTRSASLPQIGVETAVASRLAVMTQVYWDWVPPRSAMMTGIEVDTTVPESTATNIPTMRPEIAVKTSRAERAVSRGVEEVVVTVEDSCVNS
ncbi:hypothetical protein QFZ53_003333 [Microbacterium natoriense]|uniref:Uncharacterized protein n=1 Tax=Microbacterium natoriense TaxID=284570 RepID=A0AAW8F1K6_9MICO|nr:hypothetical protein [Microbacterium natoriense]